MVTGCRRWCWGHVKSLMNFSVLYYRGKSFDISILSKKKSAIIVVKSKVLKEHYETFSKERCL